MQQLLRSEFAVLHFDASEEKHFDIKVLTFVIEEALSQPFKVVVHFLSNAADLPFDDIVGRGAAISLKTGSGLGERVWAGVCSELVIEHSEQHTDSAPLGLLSGILPGVDSNSYKGNSRYKATIRPDFWRADLRQNCRIFQKMDAAAIVKEICKDYNIEVEEKLREIHPVWEYRVQYNESDLRFMNRILEESGITYWIRPSPDVPIEERKKGDALTHLILIDRPNDEKSLYDAKSNLLHYTGDREDLEFQPDQLPPNGMGGGHDFDPHIWSLSAVQQTVPLTIAIRARDFREPLDNDPHAPYPEKKELRDERYERFSYEPNAFECEVEGPLEEHADDRGTFRKNAMRMQNLPQHRYQEELAGRTVVKFSSNALDLEPSTVFQIGKDIPNFKYNHPHPAFKADKRLLIVKRTIQGRQQGSGYRCVCEAVYAKEPFRPRRRTPKPKIFGVQSAVVVGPKGAEIHTDEHGRVRVQFPWDRYGTFDDKSSCWLRVSQASAGGGYGFVALPRVGHEVLVGFFEGDPDQPVIVGRVYSETRTPPWGKVTDVDAAFGNNWTRSGIRTDSSPHNGAALGYNELMFQDQAGREEIHFQAQKDMTYTINDAERKHVGSTVTHTIGVSESHDIGSLFNVRVGRGPSTEIKMTPTTILLTTGEASIEIDGPTIRLNAKDQAHFHAENKVHLSSNQEIDIDAPFMTIDTEGDGSLLLNCGNYDPCTVVAEGAGTAGGPRRGDPSPPPALPSGGGPDPLLPGDLEHANVGYQPPTVTRKASTSEEPPPTDRQPRTSELGFSEEGFSGAALGTPGFAPPVGSGWNPAAGGLAVPGLASPGFAGGFPGVPTLPSGMPDPAKMSLPQQQQLVRSLWGNEMPASTLGKNIAASLVPSGNGAKDLANMVAGHAHPDFLKSVGPNLLTGVVGQLLTAQGLPGPLAGVAGAGVQQILGAAGPGALEKAVFGGAVQALTSQVDTKLGMGAFTGIAKLVG